MLTLFAQTRNLADHLRLWLACRLLAVPLPAGPPADPPRLAPPPPPSVPLTRPNLSRLAQPETILPKFVQDCPVAQKYLRLLADLDWEHFPERPTNRAWPGPEPAPRAPFVAAYLVKLEEGKRYMSGLRQYLVEHPALVWLLGFPLVPSAAFPWGFDGEKSLPSAKHFGRVLRELPNLALQFLLDGTVSALRLELPPDLQFGERVAVDTKHIPSTSSGQASPGSRRTTPRSASATATTKPGSPRATPIVAWAARSATSAPRPRAPSRPPQRGKQPPHRPPARCLPPRGPAPSPANPPPPAPHPRRPARANRPARPRWGSSIGAMPLAWLPPRSRSGANSS